MIPTNFDSAKDGATAGCHSAAMGLWTLGVMCRRNTSFS